MTLMQPCARKQRAYTIIELMVAICIIGILVGILLPAVQSARESARNTQCVANQRQIGLALHNYYSSNNVFPSAQMEFRFARGTTIQGNAFSELAFILNYLDQVSLHNSLNFDFAFSESADLPTTQNHTSRNTKIETFLCPSDRGTNNYNSYRFNRGRYQESSGYFDGAFGFTPTQASISDGLSTTAFVSERTAGDFIPRSVDSRRNIRVPLIFPGSISNSEMRFIDFCLSDATSSDWIVTPGRYWLFSGFVYGNYNHNGTPNDPRPTCQTGTLRDVGTGGLSPPRSLHHGFVNVLLGDGHVESVSNNIDPRVWGAMGTRSGAD